MKARQDIITDASGVARCRWCVGDPLYLRYHDEEWGFPTADDVRLFEKICLEGFQCGLSWLTILRKRENFRAAFRGFDMERVARMTKRDVDRLLRPAASGRGSKSGHGSSGGVLPHNQGGHGGPSGVLPHNQGGHGSPCGVLPHNQGGHGSPLGIVRHRGKIESTINNARRAIEAIERHGSLAAFLWSFEPARTLSRQTMAQLPATIDESVNLSKALRKLGWSFVGPTTMYAFMQAVGMVNDHLAGCAIHDEVEHARHRFTRPRSPV